MIKNADELMSFSKGEENLMEEVCIMLYRTRDRERSGSVVEYLTRDRRAADSSLTGVTALCPWAGHINPCLEVITGATQEDPTQHN